jgi:peptide/nickel transport system permease protein
MGASTWRILFLHIAPMVMPTVINLAALEMAYIMLVESGLSFLGMGIQAPQPSWGLMLSEGRDYLSNAWWLATAPGVMISLVVLGANLLGDGLRDLLDPHLG